MNRTGMMTKPHFSISKLAGRDDIRAALLLFGLLAVTFFPVVFGDKTLLESAQEAASIMPYGAWAVKATPGNMSRVKDAGAPAWEVEPLLQLTRQEYTQEKTLPIWNPYQAFGTPLAANMQSQTYFPLTVALALKHSPRMRNWYILARLFVAGFCAYLFIRFFVSFTPALAAGVTSMFAGYYVLYISMPHLSVETLLPAALLCAEYLLRNQRFRSLACFAVLVFLSLTGGMPESSLLLLTLTYIYVFVRLLSDPVFRGVYVQRIRNLVIATCFGFGLSAILLLPFRQFLRYSFDTHQFSNTGNITGLLAEARDRSIFTYLFPLLYGAGWDNNLRNYTGLIALFLLLVAVLGISWRNQWVNQAGNRNLTVLTGFFGVLVLLVVSKRYGVPVINSFGSLPLFNLVLYPKYEEPILSLAMSMLCAIGLERLSQWRVSPIKQALALAIAFLPIPVVVLLSADVIGKELVAGKTTAQIALWAILLPACLLVSLSLVLLLLTSAKGAAARRQGSKEHDNGALDTANVLREFSGRGNALPDTQTSPIGFRLSVAVLVILTCESLGNYLLPMYYVWNQLPTVASNPYVGAPFVIQLRKLAGYNRIFAEDGVLHPDWASAFNLFDIRSLDAMYYRKYLPFVRAFFPPGTGQPGHDLYDRFTGASDPFLFKDPIEQRLLQMSSVKYVVAMPGTTLEKTLVDEILSQNADRLRPPNWQLSRQVLAVGGDWRTALGEHPPYDRLPYHITVSETQPAFHFSFGINPAAFPICGDGVEFIVEARNASGAITKLFSRFIDPRHDEALRKWIDGSADLRPFRGQNIDILLSTNGGPKGDICADWAVWSGFHFDDDGASMGPFKLVYKNEVNIFEYQKVLPRAAIYFNADVKPSENEVRKSLAAPSLDVFQTVLLNGAALDRDQADWVKGMPAAPGRLIQEANITSYSSRIVTLQANLDRRGILVLNDSDFPGWKVGIDGKPARFVTANYLFRGVFLEPGKHTVRFDYAPGSVQLGAAISAASLLSLGLFGFVRIRRAGKIDRGSVG